MRLRTGPISHSDSSSYSALSRPWARATITVAVSCLVATQLSLLPSFSPIVYLLLAPLALAGGYVVTRGPHWCLSLLLVLTVVGGYRLSVQLGPVDLRVTDLAFVPLLGWVIASRLREGKGRRRTEMGQRQLGLLVAVFAMSLVPLMLNGGADLLAGWVSWGRLLVTVMLVWMVPHAVRTQKEREGVFGALLLACGTAVVLGLAQTSTTVGVSGRAESVAGPNQTGLFAAILLVSAIHAPVPRHRGLRILGGALGVLGLLGARSVGSIIAVGLTLAFLGLRPVRPRGEVSRPALTPFRLAFIAVAALGVVTLVRPINVPGKQDFRESTTLHRTIVAFAGLELFHQRPVLGIGWQRSFRADTIGSEDVAVPLRKRFPDAPKVFFPSVELATVHNAYIQTLAEAGLIGMAALIATFVVVRRRTALLVASFANRAGAEARLAACLRGGLLLVVIWWNENPLYGAEPETVMASTFIGLLASYSLVRRDEPAVPAADAAEPALQPS